MSESILTIIAGLIGVIAIIIKARYNADAEKKRSDHERDKEIANKDHIAKSKRLSNLLDVVKLRNAKKGSDSSS